MDEFGVRFPAGPQRMNLFNNELPQRQELSISPIIIQENLNLSELLSAGWNPRTDETIYTEHLGKSVQLIIRALSLSDGHTSFPYLTLTVFEENGEDELVEQAAFEFIWGKEEINLVHRESLIRERGVSGTELLHKAIDMMKILIEKAVLPERPLVLTSGNVYIVSWALKNGFTFSNPKEKEIYENTKPADKVSEDDAYVLVPPSDSKEYPHKYAYIIGYTGTISDIGYSRDELRDTFSLSFKLSRPLHLEKDT